MNHYYQIQYLVPHSANPEWRNLSTRGAFPTYTEAEIHVADLRPRWTTFYFRILAFDVNVEKVIQPLEPMKDFELKENPHVITLTN